MSQIIVSSNLFQMKLTKTITKLPFPWMEMSLKLVCIIHPNTQSQQQFAQSIPPTEGQMECHEPKNHPHLNQLGTIRRGIEKLNPKRLGNPILHFQQGIMTKLITFQPLHGQNVNDPRLQERPS